MKRASSRNQSLPPPPAENVQTKEPARHPGEVLLDDFMKPLGLNGNRLAVLLHVVSPRISELLNGHRSMTCETALRLARFFGTTPRFWLELQVDYDLSLAEQKWSILINREIEPIGDRELIGQVKSASQLRSSALARSSARSAGVQSTFDAETKTKDPVPEMTDNQKTIYGLLCEDELIHFNVLLVQSGLTVAELSPELMMMVLDNLVEQHDGDRYRRVLK